jgi:hypothetical protein
MAMPDFNEEPIELRCPGGLLGVMTGIFIEVKCRHWACTRGDSVTYHTINTVTGEITHTERFKDPIKEKK